MLAALQILATLLLLLIFIALLALIISVNPDLEYERQKLVTPAVHRIATWAIDRTWLRVAAWTIILGGVVGAAAGWSLTRSEDNITASDTDQLDETSL